MLRVQPHQAIQGDPAEVANEPGPHPGASLSGRTTDHGGAVYNIAFGAAPSLNLRFRMPNDTHRAPLTSWPRPVVVATVLAYRRSMGEQPRAPVADCAARAAFLAAGAGPDRAGGAVVEGARRLAATNRPERLRSVGCVRCVQQGGLG